MAFRVAANSFFARTVIKNYYTVPVNALRCSAPRPLLPNSSLSSNSHLNHATSRNLCQFARCRYQVASSPVSRLGVSVSRASYSTKPGYSERVKVVLKEYGRVGFVFYMMVSLTSLGTCYLLVDNGLDVVKILKYFNVNMEDSSLSKGASTFAIAYVFHKFLLPVRATVTIAGVPMIVRALRSRGWMQEPMKKVRESVKKQMTK